MKPTVQNVLDRTRTFIGDDDVAGGQDATNSILIPHYQSAYSDMFRVLTNLQADKVQAEAFYLMPAYQTALDPASAGVTDLGETVGLEERGSATSQNVSNATPGTNQLVLQVNGHGLTNGSIVWVTNVGGISQDIDGTWGITVQDANNIILLGCTATGTYTSGGTIVTSSEQFIPMERVDRIDLLTAVPSQTLAVFAVEGRYYQFRGAITPRHLRIIYHLSGNAPTATSSTIQVDDSLDYLALQTAYRFARARDLVIADQLKADATWVLGNMGNIGVRELQQLAIRKPPFRPKRSPFALF